MLDKLRQSKQIYKLAPVFITGLFTAIMAMIWKQISYGGPIISDEWAYFEPIQHGRIQDSKISTTGNFVFNLILDYLTTKAPIYEQVIYVVFNLLCFIAILLIVNELVLFLNFKSRLALLSIISFSGVTIYISTVLPEITAILLALSGLLMLIKFNKHQMIYTIGITGLTFVAPFIKTHLLLFSFALFLQLLLNIRRTKRVRLLATSFFVLCVLILLLRFFWKYNSYDYYLGVGKALDLDISSMGSFALLTLSTIALLTIFGAQSVIASEHTVSVFLIIYLVLNVMVFSIFNWTAGSLGSFELNRLHGRYFLPLIFVMLPIAVKRCAIEVGFGRKWLLGIAISCTALIIFQLTFLNIYPWDDPFFIGLSQGKSPHGWELGGYSPLLFLILVFTSTVFLIRFLNWQVTSNIILYCFFLSLATSSSIGVTEWVLINKKGAAGQGIVWVKENKNSDCYPADFPSFVIRMNVSNAIKECN